MGEPSPSMGQVRGDFDRIAPFADDGWDHNSHYHTFLLRQLPGRCGEVLEVGCGTGSLARLLAHRADRVLALDLSPEMIRVARERSPRDGNIAFEVADVATRPLPADRFDTVVSIATLHHLPFEATLARLAASLRPGGMLIVFDLYERNGPIDGLLDLVAAPASLAWRLARCGRFRVPAGVRKLWADHGSRDRDMTFGEIRRVSEGIPPGLIARRHLFWRYSLIWRKPRTVGVEG